MKTEQMQELKPCPFCGHAARSRDYGRGRVGVQCMEPSCRATSMLSLPGEDAIAAWNTRQPDPRVTAMIDEVFAEDVVAQANRLDVHSRGTESPGQWMMRVRKAALLATFKSEPSS